MILDGKTNTITFMDKSKVKLTEEQVQELAITFMLVEKKNTGAPWLYVIALGIACVFLLVKVYT